MSDRKAKKQNGSNQEVVAAPEAPKSVQIASKGIRTAPDASEFLSALIGDTMTEAVPVRIANTSVNAMGKLLKVAELQLRYGKVKGENTPDQLVLVKDREPDCKEQKRQELLRQLNELDD